MSFVYPAFSSSRFSAPSAVAFAIGLLVPMANVTIAFAQSQPTAPAPPAGGGAPPAGGAPAPGTVTQVPGPTVFQTYPGGVAPTPPGQTLGGGNAEFSSSKPITGNERDSFDFKHGGAGTGSVHGSDNNSFVLGGGPVRGTPGIHVVRRGDTLWGICDFYFQNPYQWPRVWSYNPQIQNPHWIYPGDQVRLRNGEVVQAQQQTAGSSLVDRRKQVPPETVFLRNEGYIEDESGNDWGDINGSREDKEILSDYDEVYIRIAGNRDVKVGQELTVFREVKRVGGGKLIEIQGTVKVDQWNPKERIARARITETLDTIERGARVGPVGRRFEVVPPVRNEKDVTASVITSVRPHEVYGANQVIFIDKGEDNGLKPGNRLFILKKGDQWHESLTTTSSAKRIALEDESPAATENVPRPRNDQVLPEEVQAELRLINVKKHTAMAIVTASRREIELGDLAYARKGY